MRRREVFDLVEELFTPEEAELAAKMPLSSIPAETFAREIAGGDPKEVESLLETMANKGLVFTREKGGVRYYNLMLLLPGIFEMQFLKGEVNDRARKLARLFEDYSVASQPSAAAPTRFAIFPAARVITVEKEIPAGVEIHPYDRVSEYISKADYIAVGTCYCRHHGELLGRPCEKPKDVCMSFGPTAEFISERGFGRLVSKEEALKVLDCAEKAGLIHCSNNIGKYIDFICNCCDCHCLIIQGIKKATVLGSVATSSFIASIEEEDCNGCGDCVERCQMDALALEGDIVVQNAERCIGCGLCVSVCPTEALRLELREGVPVPPFDRQEFNVAMMSSLQQNR
jgi:ferredoxin